MSIVTDFDSRVSTKINIRTPFAVIFLTTSLFLSSCGNVPTRPEASDPEKPFLSLETVQAYIDETKQSLEPEKTTRLINAILFLLKEGDTDWAHSLVDLVNPSEIDDRQFTRLMLVRGKIAIAEGEPYLAQRYLFHSRLSTSLTESNAEDSIALLDLRATLMYDLSEYMSAIDSRITLAEFINDDEMQSQLNHDLMWESLSEIPTQELFNLAKSEKEVLKQGWYSLAALSKSNGANFRQQIIDINKWRDIWPEHPANTLLPADLQLILQLADGQAQQIALLLPFSGKLAQASSAIKDGLLAAYYDDAALTSYLPTLRFYDTNNRDINIIYDLAMSDGAELIIGPLDKKNVSLLSERETLPVPTLALNNIEEDFLLEINKQQHLSLFQFGLAVESEAKQVANRAWRDGKRRALIIAPSSSWGDRASSAFSNEWRALGGNIAGDRRYDDQRNYSSLIESSVGVDQSKLRHKELQRLLATPLEFEPRRRNDIDFIFLLSNASNGKRLKPLLAFHYAGDIPVYSTSQIYDGKDGNELADLNGIRFTTLPWYFDDALGERRAIQAYGNNVTGLQSLYAMGIDAYHIYPRLQQLQKISQAQFYGSTGKLRVNSQNKIAREQTWAEIKNSKAIELTYSAQENNDI